MKIKASRVGEVAVVTASGAISAGASILIRTALIETMQARDARAMVLDLLGAVLLISPERWVALADDNLPPVLAQTPICYVMPEVYQAHGDAMCIAFAERGIVRANRASLQAALVWAAQCRERWPCAPDPCLPLSAQGAPARRSIAVAARR